MLSIPVPDARPEELVADLVELIAGSGRAQAAVLIASALRTMVEPLLALGHPEIAATVYGAVDTAGVPGYGIFGPIYEAGLDQGALAKGRSLSLHKAVELVELVELVETLT